MRKLAIFAGAYALGVFLAQYLLPRSVLLPGAAGLALLTAAAVIVPKGLPWRRFMLVCAGLSLALAWNALYIRTVQMPMLALAGQEQTVTMTLCDYPEETDWGAKATVTLPRFSRGKAVYYGEEALLSLAPGQTVTAPVAFQDASRIREDAVTTFTSKGVFLLAYNRGEELYGPGTMASPRWWPLRLGRAMGGVIDTLYTGDTAAFLKGLLTGDASGLSQEGRAALSESGLSHIMAVSGMHCGYLLSMAMLLIGRHRSRLLALIVIPVMAFYALLTGGSPSVLRAFVMMVFLVVGPVFDRRTDVPTALAAALMCILLANPFAAASISLQLSFAAMAGLMWLPGRIYEMMIPAEERKARRQHLGYLAVCSAASTMGALVFTVPVSGYYFGNLVLIAPLSNLLCLGASGLAFLTGLLTVAAGLLFPPLGQLLSIVPGVLSEYVLWAAGLLSRVPYHAVSFANPYLKYWLGYVYILFLLAWIFGPKGRKKYALAVLCAAATLAITVKAGQLRYHSGLDVVVLDVGQGQCVALKSGGKYALVDCGSGSSWLDAGDIAAQQLQTMGCKSLDYLIVTHYDNDHVSGVPGLLARMKVENILLPPDADDSGLQKMILTAAEDHGTAAQVFRRRWNLTMGDTTLTIYPPLGEKEDNERGLSVLAMAGTDSVFIPGDMSCATEELLLQNYRVPAVDVLIAGHHGARSSTSEAFLEVLSPRIVCVSVGSNSYGHPHEALLARLARHGCALYRTDLQGSIHLPLDP